MIAGFAGSSADAFALFSRFEMKLEEFRGNLERSAIELAKDWRTDKMLPTIRSTWKHHPNETTPEYGH